MNIKVRKLTPLECWTSHELDLSKLRVLDCKVHVLTPKTFRDILGSMSMGVILWDTQKMVHDLVFTTKRRGS